VAHPNIKFRAKFHRHTSSITVCVRHLGPVHASHACKKKICRHVTELSPHAAADP
jgi:hypothetical protein